MKTVVETKYGTVEGIKKEGCIVFAGIPFAKPPVGRKAFSYPQEPESWSGVLKADKGRANPVQTMGFYGGEMMSKDCLYLNVYAPDIEEGSLPVMVWIYGGSYENGGSGLCRPGSTEMLYDMAKFAAETKTIVVTFNYRLNLYGFVNLNFLDSRFERNCGLFDQIMALRFVKENIEGFGGQKNNVTVFGQSAGAACIMALMGMEEAKGLFEKAILMSPCTEHFFTEEESRKNTREYLKLLGIKESQLDMLYEIPDEKVAEANKKFISAVRFKHKELRCAFSPVIDGVTIKDEPKKLCKKAGIPLLAGTVQEEANIFVLKLSRLVIFLMGLALKIKGKKNGKDFKHRFSDSVTEIIYTKPLDEALKNYEGKCWRYLYKYTPPDLIKNGLGCYHYSEVPVLTGRSSPVENVDDDKTKAVGVMLRKIWGDFARAGEPGWQEYLAEGFVKELEGPKDSP